jgi:hypothetical protein
MIAFYILLTIVAVVLIFSIFIKVKYPFWSSQPVFHVYNLSYYIRPVGIIQHDIPDKNKYYRPDVVVKKIDTDNMSYLETSVTSFIQTHYLQTSMSSFVPNKSNIIPYFKGHSTPCHLSTWTIQNPILHNNSGKVTAKDEIKGCMTTRPLHVDIFTVSGNKSVPSFDINYVDYLCVSSYHRKKGVAPIVIYTHQYTIQREPQRIPVSLFKREDEITGIVPLCFYKTITFDMSKWTMLAEVPANRGVVIRCDSSNYTIVHNFIQERKNAFQICILPSIGNMISLMESENLYVYMLLNETQILQSVYFFRNCCMKHENGENNLSLVASIRVDDLPDDIFAYSCKLSITKIVKEYGEECNYKYFSVENISSNDAIVEDLNTKNAHISSSPTAYFFYNFACPTYPSNKTFILN